MAVLPVWCEGWALGCCGDANPAVVGARWKPWLVTTIENDVPSEFDLGWWWIDDGEIAVIGEMSADESRSVQPIIDLGDLKVAAKNEVEGRFTATTKIYDDWHVDIDPNNIEFVSVEGVVQEVFLYEPILEQQLKPRRLIHRGYEPPVEVGSTAGWLKYSSADALVLLDLGR
jgi:hypothetical protein